MNTLILGAGGQLATYLESELKQKTDNKVTSLNIDQFDITSSVETQTSLFKELKPEIIINCAAYTNVDKAEEEQSMAQKINGDALTPLSLACNEVNAELIHISTDFVFSGDKGRPYLEDDDCSPLNVYGQSKWLGEKNIINNCKNYSIFRTSWLYSSTHPCFYKTMINLSEKTKQLRVIYDQIGTPTSASSLASAIHHYIQQKDQPANKIYHASNEGICSWYDFAFSIFKKNNIDMDLTPIETKDYPTPATRPHYSVMSKQKFYDDFNYRFPHWSEALKNV